ncbi:hypothetical protein ACLKA7_007418 [Drosophila subpalustris]
MSLSWQQQLEEQLEEQLEKQLEKHEQERKESQHFKGKLAWQEQASEKKNAPRGESSHAWHVDVGAPT